MTIELDHYRGTGMSARDIRDPFADAPPALRARMRWLDSNARGLALLVDAVLPGDSYKMPRGFDRKGGFHYVALEFLSSPWMIRMHLDGEDNVIVDVLEEDAVTKKYTVFKMVDDARQAVDFISMAIMRNEARLYGG